MGTTGTSLSGRTIRQAVCNDNKEQTDSPFSNLPGHAGVKPLVGRMISHGRSAPRPDRVKQPGPKVTWSTGAKTDRQTTRRRCKSYPRSGGND